MRRLEPIVLTDYLLTRRSEAAVVVFDGPLPTVKPAGLGQWSQYYQIDVVVRGERVRFYVVVDLYDDEDKAIMRFENLESRSVIMDKDRNCPAMLVVYYHSTVACAPCMVSSGPIPL